jgi:hypothetical protein
MSAQGETYPDQITLSQYITARWKQLGVKHVFGVPGAFLDLTIPCCLVALEAVGDGGGVMAR